MRSGIFTFQATKGLKNGYILDLGLSANSKAFINTDITQCSLCFLKISVSFQN